MTLPLIKICGFTNIDTLESISHLQIDYIGFVFAYSRRQVSSGQAAEMIAWMQRQPTSFRPQTVGVFVNPSFAELEACLQTASLDVIQLHGQETPECCRQIRQELGRKVFKVFSVPPQSAAIEATILQQLDAYAGVVDAIMLDTFDPLVGGGSGKSFSWDNIPVVQVWAKRRKLPLFIAGGLNPDNIGRLIAQYAPDGVDVSSGVETEGMKAPEKIKRFVERVSQS